MLAKPLVEKLEQIAGKENVLTSKISLEIYAYDASPFTGNPGAVVFPTTTEMVAEIVKLAKENNVPLMARGAGSCLSGGAVAPGGGIVLSLTKMNKILEIDPLSRVAVVQPGVTNKMVQEACAPYGLMFAPDPASQNIATIGGNIAENSGGMRGVKYGTTKDHILGLEVVLSSGDVITTGGINSQIEPEIDLTYYFCGSEGTLGIITKAWLALSPINSKVKTMTAVFDSIEKAGACVAEIIAKGIGPTTMEILDNTCIKAVDDYLQLGLPRDAAAFLLIEIDGFQSDVKIMLEGIIKAFENNKALEYKIAQNEKERQDLWKARRSVNGALGKLKPAYFTHDIVVPRDRLADMLGKVAELAQKYDIIIANVAHAGDGNLHPAFYYDHRIPEEVEKVEIAADELIRETIAQGGTISGEHGIGIEKLKYMTWAFSKPTLQMMQDVKNAFDPRAIMNPGKLLPQVGDE
ncbi:MAG: FAD-binding protein [Clostridia bacterium]|nr:FAD-binding protein [Clostridia bacterium]